jgi:hypothetical protein
MTAHPTHDCVAVAAATATVAVADTKTRHAEAVEVAPAAWASFIAHFVDIEAVSQGPRGGRRRLRATRS